MIDKKTVLLMAAVAVSAFMIGFLISFGGSEEPEAQASAPPDNTSQAPAYERNEMNEDSKGDLSAMFSDPNGIEPPTLPE
jgi:hypothetical protein